MELPPPLRAAIDEALANTPIGELIGAGETLSRRYRAETRDGRLHLSDDLFAKAYVAARMPATFAALRACLSAIAEARPDFAPTSLLDVGAGPGTALWAAANAWPTLDAATLLEASAPIRRMGETLSAGAFAFRPRWLDTDLTRDLPELPQADLVTLSYVLDELDPARIPVLLESLWARTRGVLLIAEPGTPAGWRRILAVRDQLLERGAFPLAPCPHAAACPVKAPDWCHFARRVARSRLHRRTKEAEVPWEDEKFAYVAVARTPDPAPSGWSRVLAPPRSGSGKVRLKLCKPNGALAEPLLTKRDGEAFRQARRADWGDAVME